MKNNVVEYVYFVQLQPNLSIFDDFVPWRSSGHFNEIVCPPSHSNSSFPSIDYSNNFSIHRRYCLFITNVVFNVYNGVEMILIHCTKNFKT